MASRIPLALLAAAASAALVLTGCSTPTDGGDEPAAGGAFGDCELTADPATIEIDPVTEGTLTVLTVLPNPGWWNGDSADSLTGGFEYCMAAEFANRAGFDDMTIKVTSWDQYISGMSTDFDLAMVTTTITDERKEIMDFSQPYFQSNLGVALAVDSAFDESTIRDARIAILQGSTGAQWVNEELQPTQQPSLFNDANEMFTALAANQVDAVITDTTTALTQSKPTAGKTEVVAQYALDQGYGVVSPLDSPNSPAIDQAVGDMIEDGTLDRLSAQYLEPLFGVDPNAVPYWEL